jgi:hypothetical protein
MQQKPLLSRQVTVKSLAQTTGVTDLQITATQFSFNKEEIQAKGLSPKQSPPKETT